MSLKNVIRQRLIYDQKFNSQNDTYYQSYELGKLLGKGGFAHVYEVFKTNDISPQMKAVKVMCLKDKNGNNKDKIQAQIKLMQLASQNSDSFVKYYHSFIYSDKYYIIMELCEWGSMSEVVKTRKVLTEPQVRYFIQQFLMILIQLKKKGIVHRDIKPGNILISSNFKFKLADFGLAISHQEISKAKTICGTPNYLAPEVVDKKGYSYEVDLWAMGVMMFTTLYGIAPFQTQDIKQTYQRIKKGIYKFEGPNKSLRISQEAKSLIKDILKTQPSQRIKLQQIPMHSFLCSYEIPRKLDKDFIKLPPQAQFVRKYMKKIIPKNDIKPIKTSQNNSKTTLQKKQSSVPKITYRNCLGNSTEKEKQTIEYKFAQHNVKIQQFVDLELSRVQTSTSVKKRQKSPMGSSLTPKKMFKNNHYKVKNQIKIEKIEQIIEKITEYPENILKEQEIFQPRNTKKEPSRILRLKSSFTHKDLSRYCSTKKTKRSFSQNVTTQQQLSVKKRNKQQQTKFKKQKVRTVIWQKIMQNGDLIYTLSNWQHGILFRDKTQATTKDFQVIKFNQKFNQVENQGNNQVKLISKKSIFLKYRNSFHMKSKVKVQPLGLDESIDYLKEFALVDNGKYFIFDKGILQFRHKNGWLLRYIQGETHFFYQDEHQTEILHINSNNLNLYNKQISSRFLEFLEMTHKLTDILWPYNQLGMKEQQINRLDIKEQQIQSTNKDVSKLEYMGVERLFL